MQIFLGPIAIWALLVFLFLMLLLIWIRIKEAKVKE